MIFRCSPIFYPRTISSILLPILLALPAFAQEKENIGVPDEPAVMESFAKPAPVIYKPDNRSDPFLNIIPRETVEHTVEDAEMSRGAPPPGIAGTFIDNAGLEGIAIRADNRRTAIVRAANNRAYYLSEGDRLFDGYLKTIEKDSVVFVRETFMQSGKIVVQEVTKRLRKS